MSKKMVWPMVGLLIILNVVCVMAVASPKVGNSATIVSPELRELISTYHLHLLSSIPLGIKPIPVKSIAELRMTLSQFQKPITVAPDSKPLLYKYYPGGGNDLHWVTWTVKSRVFSVYFWGVDLWLTADAYYYPGQYFESVYERVGLSGTAFPYSVKLEDPWHYHQIMNQGTYVMIWGGGTLHVWLIFKGLPFEYSRPVSIGMGRPVPSQ